MVHRTVKTINGRKYLYEQTSYRVAGQVKTVSKYIAPLSRVVYDTVSGVNGAVLLPDGSMLPAVIGQHDFDLKVRKNKLSDDLKDRTKKSSDKIKHTIKSPLSENSVQSSSDSSKDKFNLTPKKTKSRISIFTRLEKYKISEKSVKKEVARVIKLCSYLDMPVSDFPKIKITHGSKFSFKSKSFWTGQAILTVPKPRSMISRIMSKPFDSRKKINRHRAKVYKVAEGSHRNQFYNAFSKALSSSYLSHIEKHDKARFEKLEQIFQSQFKAKNTAISGFLKRTSKSYAQSLYFRITGALTDYYKAKRKPEFFGLTDWQARTSWKDDFEALVSEILKHGYDGVKHRYKGDIAKLQASINAKYRKKASLGQFERLSGAGRTLDKKILDDNIRLEAIKSSYEQVKALHMPFYKVHKRGGSDF